MTDQLKPHCLLELTAYIVKRHLYESLLDPDFWDGISDLWAVSRIVLSLSLSLPQPRPTPDHRPRSPSIITSSDPIIDLAFLPTLLSNPDSVHINVHLQLSHFPSSQFSYIAQAEGTAKILYELIVVG